MRLVRGVLRRFGVVRGLGLSGVKRRSLLAVAAVLVSVIAAAAPAAATPPLAVAFAFLFRAAVRVMLGPFLRRGVKLLVGVHRLESGRILDRGLDDRARLRRRAARDGVVLRADLVVRFDGDRKAEALFEFDQVRALVVKDVESGRRRG